MPVPKQQQQQQQQKQQQTNNTKQNKKQTKNTHKKQTPKHSKAEGFHILHFYWSFSSDVMAVKRLNESVRVLC